MSSWAPRRFSQRIVSEDADQMVVEATAPSETKGFFKVIGSGDTLGVMVRVQGGTLPQTSELAGTLVATFQIGRTEVTWDEWREVRDWAAGHGYSDLAAVGSGRAGSHPVNYMTWYDAVKWCNAKSEKEGLTPVYLANGNVYRTEMVVPTVNSQANGHRLPNEAEWEWAARGGVSSQGYAYSGSNDLNAVAWNDVNGDNGTKAVATKAANELGIHDMSGNVWEWCEDGAYAAIGRRIRGGSYADRYADRYAVSSRGWAYPQAFGNVGFRVARNAD